MALDLIEHGFVIEGAESATRLPIGPIAPAALTSLLDHEDREIRTRAVLLAARASEQPARREGGRRRA